MENLFRIIFLLIIFNVTNGEDCIPSIITTASGTAAPEQICSGQLIFEENFDILDKDIWKPEVTFWGGGVSTSRLILMGSSINRAAH